MKRQNPPERIETERLLIKRHTLGAAVPMFELVERDRKRLDIFLPWVEHMRTLDDEYAYVRMTVEHWDIGDLFDFGIYRKSDNSYLGNVGVHNVSWQHERCELGYWIAAEFEGQGFVTEATGALERALFSVGFNRVEIRCSSANARSAAVPRRLGFRLEGTLRQDQVEHGGYRDTLIFAKLKKEP